MKAVSPETLLLISLAVGIIPLLVGVGTCYLKFSIVLSLLRSGFGTQQAPSNALVLALSMVMSLVVMSPVLVATSDRLDTIALLDLRGVPVKELLRRGADVAVPWRDFLVTHAGEREVSTFMELTNGSAPQTTYDQPRPLTLGVALAAFVLSEIKGGFILAFLLLLPFFVIDIVISNVLVAMGLTMMSPTVVALPLKLLLFVSTDGWLLLARGLISSYR